MKQYTALFIALVFTGCANNDHQKRYVNYGKIQGDRVQIPPCNPFRADELMDWATQLDGHSYQKRTAQASVDAHGWVRCRSTETAGSSSFNK